MNGFELRKNLLETVRIGCNVAKVGGEGTVFERRDPKVAWLQSIPLFRDCDRDELRTISRLGDLATYEPGSVLIEQGTLGGEAFVVIDGAVAVTRDGDTLATLGSGSVVGEVALLDGGRRTATVAVVGDAPAEILIFDPRSFETLLEDVPKVARRMLTEMSHRLRRSDERDPGPASA